MTANWIRPPILQISEWDADRDEITIEGICYSGMLFRLWGTNGLPAGSLFRIAKRSDDKTLPVVIEHEPRNRFVRAWTALWP